MISQSAEYALRAVVCLAANPNSELTAKQISQLTQAPVGYLSKVMQTLAKANIVHSQRGKQGGFALNIPSDQLTILMVINAISPLKRLSCCFLGMEIRSESLSISTETKEVKDSSAKSNCCSKTCISLKTSSPRSNLCSLQVCINEAVSSVEAVFAKITIMELMHERRSSFDCK